MTSDLVAAAPARPAPDARFEACVHKIRAAAVLDEIAGADVFDLAILAVVLRTMLRMASLA